MTYNEINERLDAIAKEMLAEGADLDALTNEVAGLKEQRDAIVADMEKRGALAAAIAEGRMGTPVATPAAASEAETRANTFRKTGKLEMRTLLGTGYIAKPTRAGGVGGLAEVASGIVDDVNAISLTGNGAWVAAYKATDAAAAAVTDGSTITGTAGTFNVVTIAPAEWGVLDAISNQVRKYTDVDYMTAIENSALIALRSKAAAQIVSAISASSLVATMTNVALDASYLRKLMMGYRSVEGKGDVFLYITSSDLATLGNVRGTNEKKPVYEFKFDQGTTTSGIIQDGGMAVRFRVLDQLSDGTQLFGQPGTVDMPMWDGYEITTDEGGEYFQKNLIGIRGLQTANADLVVYHGMVKVSNPT